MAPIPTLRDRIVRSAACAATDPGKPPEAVVRAALACGERAAEHGCGLPLPVLLDTWGLTAAAGGPAVSFRASPALAHVKAYDAWIEKVCGRLGSCSQLWEAGTRELALGAEALLPALLSCWANGDARPPATSRHWAEAYAELQHPGNAAREILGAWQGQRATRQGWDWWQERTAPPGEVGGHALLWTIFGVRESAFPERFDHAAGGLYLGAARPPLTPDQRMRIRYLRLRRREPEPTPDLRTPTDQDPCFGRPPLAAYVAESFDEVAHRIANRENPRLNEASPARHPHPVHVHLGWSLRYASLTAEHGNLVSPPGRPRRSANQASTVSGLVLLLLDDWRDALRELPVRFHLHRGSPLEPAGLELGRPGRRWCSGEAEETDLFPPAAVVDAVFQRATLVDAAMASPDWGRWTVDPGPSWQCGCVAECDLPEMGFRRTTGFARWEAPGGSLPAGMKHLIVVDPSSGQGVICQAWDSARDGGCRLRAMRTVRTQSAGDPSFTGLRSHALDVLLDALSARLR